MVMETWGPKSWDSEEKPKAMPQDWGLSKKKKNIQAEQ